MSYRKMVKGKKHLPERGPQGGGGEGEGAYAKSRGMENGKKGGLGAQKGVVPWVKRFRPGEGPRYNWWKKGKILP